MKDGICSCPSFFAKFSIGISYKMNKKLIKYVILLKHLEKKPCILGTKYGKILYVK